LRTFYLIPLRLYLHPNKLLKYQFYPFLLDFFTWFHPYIMFQGNICRKTYQVFSITATFPQYISLKLRSATVHPWIYTFAPCIWLKFPIFPSYNCQLVAKNMWCRERFILFLKFWIHHMQKLWNLVLIQWPSKLVLYSICLRFYFDSTMAFDWYA